MKTFQNSIFQLIVEVSTNLSTDIRVALSAAKNTAQPSSLGQLALSIIQQNIEISAAQKCTLCQDTGMISFFVSCPVDFDQSAFDAELCAAVRQATELGILRPNCVDALTGQNSGDNVGPSSPLVHYQQWKQDFVSLALILKGGGCENQNSQYSLPCTLPGFGEAGRDLDGVKRCVLHAVWEAQGQGCSPGFVGVAIGSDRASGYGYAKEQLFRRLDDINPLPALAQLESDIVFAANKLGIGTMGLGGEATLLGCKISAFNRVPASFFVSIAYNCWALRRGSVAINPSSGEILNGENASTAAETKTASGNLSNLNTGTRLSSPLTEETVRKLRVGDIVLLSGPIFTARDALHKYLLDHDAPVDLTGQVIYHCGPVVIRKNNSWSVVAAGPTTSFREEPYTATLLKKLGIRAIIGKGGMGQNTLAALQECGGVYLQAIGGAAQVYKDCITAVRGVHFLEEFGAPEAMWSLVCQEMPLIVTMDSHGNSLHLSVKEKSSKQLAGLIHG